MKSERKIVVGSLWLNEWMRKGEHALKGTSERHFVQKDSCIELFFNNFDRNRIQYQRNGQEREKEKERALFAVCNFPSNTHVSPWSTHHFEIFVLSRIPITVLIYMCVCACMGKSSQTIVHFANCSTIQLLIHKFHALCSLFVFFYFPLSLSSLISSIEHLTILYWYFIYLWIECYFSVVVLFRFPFVFGPLMVPLPVPIKTFFRLNEEAKSATWNILLVSHLRTSATNLWTAMMFTHLQTQ